jgi:beta-N-acetylhexosaminidase
MLAVACGKLIGHRRRRAGLLVLLVLALMGSGCDLGGGGGGSSPSRPGSPGSGGGPPPSCAARVLASLSESQRVGQLFLLGLAGDWLGPAATRAIHVHHVGSVWFVATTTAGVRAVRAVADAVQAQASPEATGNVRFYVAANQEGGDIQALQGAGFSRIPSALEQGALSPSAVRTDAATWGRQLAAAGVNLDFAPVMDVVPPGTDSENQPIGALQRAFGHDPIGVGRHGVAFLRGMRSAGVATTAKHFPGLGRVVGNTDFAAAVTDDVTTVDDPYLQSFQRAIRAGVPFVMVALATYTRIDPSRLAVFSQIVIQRMLRRDLGFRGVVMSDDLGSAVAVSNIPPAERAIDFIHAGGDMIVAKTAGAAVAMADALVSRAAAEAAFRRRVNQAAQRVLEAKQASGLLPCAATG